MSAFLSAPILDAFISQSSFLNQQCLVIWAFSDESAWRSLAQNHLFVGSEFRRFSLRQIRHLPATSNQDFWADHEGGQARELHVYQTVQQPVPAIHRNKEGYLAWYSPNQNMCFGTRVLIYEKDSASSSKWSFQLPATGVLGSQGHLIS
jgi:hypothetical protein